MGLYQEMPFDPAGELLSREAWGRRRSGWLPTADDLAYVKSLMIPCHESSKIASWIAPPAKGINDKPFDYEYVKP